jgi:hypothetical protein
MIERTTSFPKEAVRYFTDAEALLSKGRFDDFMERWIQGRSVLKESAAPSTSRIAVPQQWRQLNEMFECLFELRMGTQVLRQGLAELPWVQADSPNFLGVRADLSAFHSLGRGEAHKLFLAGSGAFPQTLFFLARHSGIREFVGIDSDPERVYFATRLTDYCGLSERISFQVKNATEVDYAGADITIIASLLQGKDEVVDRVCKTAPSGSLLCLRIPRGWGAAFYEQKDVSLAQDTRLKVLRGWVPAEHALFETIGAEVLSLSTDREIPDDRQSNPLNTSFFEGRL